MQGAWHAGFNIGDYLSPGEGVRRAGALRAGRAGAGAAGSQATQTRFVPTEKVGENCSPVGNMCRTRDREKGRRERDEGEREKIRGKGHVGWETREASVPEGDSVC